MHFIEFCVEVCYFCLFLKLCQIIIFKERKLVLQALGHYNFLEIYFAHVVCYLDKITYAQDFFLCGSETCLNKNASLVGPNGLTFLFKQLSLSRERIYFVCAILSKCDKTSQKYVLFPVN